MAKRKFKVGDLVRVYGLNSIAFYSGIESGSCAIVTEVIPELGPDEPFNENFFFEYKIMTKGQIYYMFEDEMQFFREEDNPCVSCECTPCDCDWGIE